MNARELRNTMVQIYDAECETLWNQYELLAISGSTALYCTVVEVMESAARICAVRCQLQQYYGVCSTLADALSLAARRQDEGHKVPGASTSTAPLVSLSQTLKSFSFLKSRLHRLLTTSCI